MPTGTFDSDRHGSSGETCDELATVQKPIGHCNAMSFGDSIGAVKNWICAGPIVYQVTEKVSVIQTESQIIKRRQLGNTPTTVRHGCCRLRLKIRYDGAEIGLGLAGRFRWHIRSLDQKNFARGFTNRAAANRLGTLQSQSS